MYLAMVVSSPRPEWYGMLYSQADSKKKSNLMMSLFEPGPEPLPWLGKMAQLGPTSGRACPVESLREKDQHCWVGVTSSHSKLILQSDKGIMA